MKRSCGAIVTLAMTAIAAAACSAGDSRHSPIEKGSGSASGDPSIITFWKTVPEATRLRLKGDFAGAAAIYEKALSLNPDHEDSLYYLGQCRVALGQYEEAARVFSKLIAVNPDSPRAHLGLGATLAAPDSAAPLDLAGAERH
ncbi:MAG: tetratricopeptide repeat protein, partial [Acidobacteriota bacterium]